MNCSTFVLYLGRKNNDRHWFEQEAASIVDCSKIWNVFTEWRHVGEIRKFVDNLE